MSGQVRPMACTVKAFVLMLWCDVARSPLVPVLMLNCLFSKGYQIRIMYVYDLVYVQMHLSPFRTDQL